MKLTRAQREAISLVRGFRERAPGKIVSAEIDIPDSLAIIGHVEFIGYRTTHGRRAELYTHDFAPGSRPLLCAGTGVGQLFLVGGRYRVTDRGIVDLDVRGREIDDGGWRK